MKPVAVLRNDAQVPPGHLGDVLDDREIAWDLVRLDEGAPLPAVGDVGGIVALGGHMGAYDEASFPYLAGEKRLLRDAVARDLPVLGICLGCQLMAESLGGAAYLAACPEAQLGVITVEGDPVVAPMGVAAVLTIHRDTWDVPPRGRLVAWTEAFPQAFTLGSGLGIQPHPEVVPATVATWFAKPSARDTVAAGGADADQILALMRQGEAAYRDMAWEVFGTWADRAFP